MKLDTLRTPDETDSFHPIECEGDGPPRWGIWDAEWDETTEEFEGPNAERLAKAGAIEAIVERYGEYDDWNPEPDEFDTSKWDPIERDAEGVPVTGL